MYCLSSACLGAWVLGVCQYEPLCGQPFGPLTLKLLILGPSSCLVFGFHIEIRPPNHTQGPLRPITVLFRVFKIQGLALKVWGLRCRAHPCRIFAHNKLRGPCNNKTACAQACKVQWIPKGKVSTTPIPQSWVCQFSIPRSRRVYTISSVRFVP